MSVLILSTYGSDNIQLDQITEKLDDEYINYSIFYDLNDNFDRIDSILVSLKEELKVCICVSDTGFPSSYVNEKIDKPIIALGSSVPLDGVALVANSSDAANFAIQILNTYIQELDDYDEILEMIIELSLIDENPQLQKIINHIDFYTYNSRKLLPNDANVLRYIENILGKQLPHLKIDEVNDDESFGFSDEKFQVNGLGLNQLEGLDSLTFQLLMNKVMFLSNLKCLSMEKNQLTVLNPSIGLLVDLEVLDLEDNELMSLPRSVCRLTELKKLDVESNNLTSLPDCIGSLIKLEELDLEGNNLAALPASIINLKNLKMLDLTENAELELTEEQKQWIEGLKSNNCEVEM